MASPAGPDPADLRPARLQHRCGAAAQAQPAARTVPAQPARQDGNIALLANKLRGANRAGVSIVQFGDSHTAADLFSGELRRLLQQRYGDGGIGLIPASSVPGIRNDRVIVASARQQWELVSARNQQSSQFPWVDTCRGRCWQTPA